jgi:anti-sigma-K factor RskA
MSETEDPGPDATLAAEYVLGTLEMEEAEAARLRTETDAAFAAEVAFWERRLMPLAMLAPAVAPPATLWARIEDSTGGAGGRARQPPAPAPRAANDNRLIWWRAATFAGLAVAAGLAVFIAVQPPAPLPVLAVLTPYSTPTPVLVAVAGPNGEITLRPTAGIKVPTDRDLELWALAAGAKAPAPLGVIPPAGKTVPPGVAEGTTLLVSLEPKGGSPTGKPTGPVLYAGTLHRFD